MKKLFQSFAKYNQETNKIVLDLFSRMSEELLFQETKAYYKTIFDAAQHILLTDRNWLKRLADNNLCTEDLKGFEWINKEIKELKAELKEDYHRLFEYRKSADEAIVTVMDCLDEDQISGILKYKNFKGEDIEMEIWKVFMQWFTHQAHHRGQISVSLDLLGIENDYSSVLNKI